YAPAVRRLLRRTPVHEAPPEPADPTLSDADRAILERCAPLSLIGTARMLSLIDAVRHCVRRDLPGAFAECGVWKGGAVLATVLSSGYPAERLHFVAGRVEDTIPAQAPDRLALLRLDTDWYESTRHELEHLYPRLAEGGVLIIDDYGHWDGARRAVDEYFATRGAPLLLSRIDYTGRIAIKH